MNSSTGNQEKEFEFRNPENGLKDLFLNGVRFTGDLNSEFEKIPFKNGCAEGKAITYFPNGQKYCELTYKKGDLIHTKEWNSDGVLIYEDNHYIQNLRKSISITQEVV